jgi:hypothetical protein
MIAWAVSTTGILTGYTTASRSQSVSADYGATETSPSGGATTFFTVFGSDSYYAFTSKNSRGTTSSYYFTTAADISSSFTSSSTGLDGTSTTTFTDSGSYYSLFPSSTTESSSGFLATIQSQTSTTETFADNKETTYQTTASISVWTTSQSESSDSVQFYQTTTTIETWTASTHSFQSTRDATTTASGSMIESATALVAQAKTGRPDAEVIYYISSTALPWLALSAASAIAQTATRITLANIYSTIAAPKITVTKDENGFEIVPSFSWSNSSSSYSAQFTTSATATTQTTLVTDSTILPNQTVTSTGQIARTTTTSFSANLWTSSSGSCSGQDSTTTSFSELATSSTAPGSSWLGSLSWNIPRTTTATRAATAPTIAAYVRNMSDAVGLGLTNNGYFYNGESGQTADQNIALVVPPQVTTAIVGNVAQAKFVPVFAQIGTSKGQWFTVGASTSFGNTFTSTSSGTSGSASSDTSSTTFSTSSPGPSYASVSRSQGTTIFPQTIDGASYGLSRLTYTSQNGSGRTTTTATLGVEGESKTTVIGSIIGIAGGSPNSSEAFAETFAYGVTAAGVFKNRIGGSTTTFDAGATTFTQSQVASFFEPITALVPALGTGSTAMFPVFWAVPRNSTALPPALPPNA